MTTTTQSDRQELATQTLVLGGVVIAFLYASAQLVTPYIAHDDWDFLVPESWGLAYSTPWDKTLSEGRWLGYLWHQVSHHLTPKSSFLIFVICYFSLVLTITRHVSRPRALGISGLALFFSPMMGKLSLWPTGAICSVTLCAAGAWLVGRLNTHYTAIVVFVVTSCLILAYPPLASVVLLVAVFKCHDASLKKKLHIGIAYILGFACGTLLIYYLNLKYHNYFGIRVAAWRTPNTPHSVTDLLTNTQLYIDYWRGLLEDYAIAIFSGIIAAALLLLQRESRSRAIEILLTVTLICGIELGISMASGTVMPSRSAIWLWVASCILCSMVLATPATWYRHIGTALLLTLFAFGATSWWRTYQSKQPIVRYEAFLASQVHQYEAMTGSRTVEVLGAPERLAEFRDAGETNVFQALQMSMRERFGITVNRCSMERCAMARSYLENHNTSPSPLMVIDGVLMLVFDPKGKGLAYERNYPSAAEEANLKLGYLSFLSYGPSSVRLTPMFPGKSNKPLSIKLASNPHGYTLRFEGDACAFPVDYELTNMAGSELTKGSMKSPEIASLPSWDINTGIAVLSLAMSNGAKDNYGCNITVTEN